MAQEENTCEEPIISKAISYYKDAEKKFKPNAEYVNSDCIMYLNEAIKLEDNYYEAYYLLGRLYYKKQNTASAEKNFKKQIEICPNYRMKTYFYLGNIAAGKGNYSDVIKYLSIYLKDVEKIEKEKEYTEEDYNLASKMLKDSKALSELVSHPVPFEPHVVEGLSSKKDEYLAILSPDNEMALYTRKVELPRMQTAWGPENIPVREMFMFSEIESGKWSDGEPLPPPFNKNDEAEGGGTLTVDNKTMYFTRCETDKRNYRNCDIFTSDFKNGEWGKIIRLDSNINNPKTWESQPSITSDGKTLYFISDRPGGFGGYDIYVSHKNEKGQWTRAENLGSIINTKGNEKAPFIHTDSQTLYFSSDGRPGLGGYDIYFSKMNEEGKWGEPKNLGYPINSSGDDVGLFVSTDGHLGYFASKQLKGIGGWDIYSFELYKEARPEKVLLIKGVVKDEKREEPVKASIELQNITTKKVTEIPVDTTTGEYALAVPFKSDFIMTVKKEGYAFTSKYFAQKDTEYVKPKNVEVDIKPLEVGEAYRLNDIYFATDSFTLTDASKVIIDRFIEFLDENPHMKIAIHGHTDNVGKAAYNLALSENRAKSVYEYMVQKGVGESRLSYKGFGETKPIASNLDPYGRAKNRRTEFVIIEK